MGAREEGPAGECEEESVGGRASGGGGERDGSGGWT